LLAQDIVQSFAWHQHSSVRRQQEEAVRHRSISAKAVAGVLAAVFGFVVPTQSLAAQPATVTAVASAETAVSSAAAARVAALTPAQLDSLSTQATEPTAAGTPGSPSFFKTSKGIAVLVLIVAGVGFASYSAVNDRDPVKSPIR
jgi:hypothetical protein